MPGINISRSEALERSEHLAIENYNVFLDLSVPGDTFIAKSTVSFTCKTPGYNTFIDAVATRILSATLNGQSVDTSTFDGQTLFINGLATENELIIEAEVAYSNTGEGLQKSVDPADGEIYLYSQGETAHIRKMYPCFDQPDLKATFTLSVLAPTHWEVLSNNPVSETREIGTNKFWEFTTTPRISTYITALVAGPYHHVHDEYVGEKVVPLGIYCRKSLAASLDPEEIFQNTKEGFAYFEKIFGLAYPFEKYDQVAVVDFNWGAMENAGVVTFREEILVFRSRVTDRNRQARAHVILHEMAHMWFGNMVTMFWWDDLWLNESFAEWTSYLALVEGTRFTNGWTSFICEGKSWAYNQDQLVTTHPIAVDMVDIESVNANFDGISYAKGSSVMHQLCAYVGRDNFIAGLQKYFKKFAWQNTKLSDLLTELKSTSGRDLDAWAATWLKTSGINTMRPVIEVQDGIYTSVAIEQSAPTIPAGSHEIRPHRIGVALYDLVHNKLVRRARTEVDVVGAQTQLPELVGQAQADVLLINDGDLAYTKIRFDEKSAQTLSRHLGDFTDPIARTLCWVAMWDMWRDAEVTNHDFAMMLLGGLETETLITLISGLGLDLVSAVEVHSNPVRRDEIRVAVADKLHEILAKTAAGSDAQLQLARIFTQIAQSPEQISTVKELLAGKLAGLEVDRDLRWFFVQALAERGAVTSTEIDAVLADDQTHNGELAHAQAIASLPDSAIKAEAWRALLNDELSNSKRLALHRGFMRARQLDLMAGYVDLYFDSLLEMWNKTSFEEASSNVEMLYPRYVVTQSTLDKSDAWLNGAGKEAPAVLRRLVSEGRDSVARTLRVQIKDGLVE
jgi:aminopeptidase N